MKHGEAAENKQSVISLFTANIMIIYLKVEFDSSSVSVVIYDKKLTLFMLQIVIAGNGIVDIDFGMESKETKTGLSTQWNMIWREE